MNKIILILLVSFGLQAQAQINYCDSMTITGSQLNIIIQTNNVNTPIHYWCTSSMCGLTLSEDCMKVVHSVFNFTNPTTGLMYDTINTCITYNTTGTVITCCVTWVWNGTSWSRMMSPTYIDEINKVEIINNKIYNLQGKEILRPKGLYIKNNKLYFND
tara:strand:- start:236 stop:712 length:477 start_codon:yes stop_codon:yes gene_type:complete